MIDKLRSVSAGVARWPIAFAEAGITHIDYSWPEQLDAALQLKIVELMRHTTASAPIIGFAEEITEEEAAKYLQELSANLAAKKVRLLQISGDTGLLIGLCTLRRNLNPNNRHITDLAKGMIREEFRGGAILPAAFYEIATQCEADGVEIVTLDVRAETPAQKAWERFGFTTYGFLPDYARAQGKVHAGHFMMQKVSELKDRASQTFVKRTKADTAQAAVQPA